MTKKPVSGKSKSKSSRDRAGSGPQAGASTSSKSFDPSHLAQESADAVRPLGHSRSAPAPGVPVSGKEYERLKTRAKSSPAPRGKHSQEDPSQKK
jgi:hypothetical protein